MGSWLLTNTIFTAARNPVAEIVYEARVLDPEGRPGARPADEVHVPYDGTRRRLQVFDEPAYRGNLTERRVRALLAAHRASALAPRLAARFARLLVERTRSVERSLFETMLAMHEEEDRALPLAEADSKNVWVVDHAKPDAKEAERRLALATAELVRKRLGKIISRGQGSRVTHILVRKDAFPIYWAYCDQFVALLRERDRRKAEVVEALFGEHGMDIFERQDEGRRSPSNTK